MRVEPVVLPREALSDRVYEAIKERIIEQVYVPNQRLRTEEVAASLGVSATPVREALHHLAAERLVVLETHRGFSVAPELDRQRYAELFDVCIMLQTRAAELGAETVSEAELEELAQAVSGMDRACRIHSYEGFRSFTAADRHFHDRIMVISRNSYLAELWNYLTPMAQLARLYDRAFATGAIVGTYSSAEHRAIHNAFVKRNPSVASELMHEHMVNSKTRWLQFAETVSSGASAKQDGRVHPTHRDDRTTSHS